MTDRPGPWVVLRSDDWPMSADTARRLAAALVLAADQVETEAKAPDGGFSPDSVGGSGGRRVSPMSDRITWEMCPTCGRRAAVGWVREHGTYYPVESDCPTGCQISASQFTQASRPSDRRPINARH